MQSGYRVQSERPPRKHGTVLASVAALPGFIRVEWDDGTCSFENPGFIRAEPPARN